MSISVISSVREETRRDDAARIAAQVPTMVRDANGKSLVAACLAGDARARSGFQLQFGSLIYRFGEVATAASDAESGDFYVYLFENDRLFRRLRTYEGRANLGAYLRGYALPDLYRQFRAMTAKKIVDTVSLDTGCLRQPGDTSAVPGASDVVDPTANEPKCCGGLFARLDPYRRLLIKLLYIEDFSLTPEEVQQLAERSQRSVREVVERVERARESVRQREARRRGKQEEAESAGQWLLRYDRKLTQLAEDLHNLSGDSRQAVRLREETEELERKRVWRQQQQQRALAETERAMVTLRYREVAELLNAKPGSVSADITHLRHELLRLTAEDARQASERKGPTNEPD
jgi:hypothetical protein